jgi:hypothetical protein
MHDFTDLHFGGQLRPRGRIRPKPWSKEQNFRGVASNAKAKSILATLLFLPLVPEQKDRKVGRMVLILNMLKLENKLIACRSANKSVQRLDPCVVDNTGLVIRIECSCDELNFYESGQYVRWPGSISLSTYPAWQNTPLSTFWHHFQMPRTTFSSHPSAPCRLLANVLVSMFRNQGKLSRFCGVCTGWH